MQRGPDFLSKYRPAAYRALNPEVVFSGQKEPERCEHSSWTQLISLGMLLSITASVVAFALETDIELAQEFAYEFRLVEAVLSVLFTLEYLLQLWASPEDPKISNSKIGRIQHIISPAALLDLAATLPFWITLLCPISIDLRILRGFRIFRLFRLRHSATALRSLAGILSRKSEELATTFFITICVLLVSSTVMYYSERFAQPDKFSSIAASLWWGVATLTTIGYGDVYPITPIGKLLGSIIALTQLGVIAMPTGIIAQGFIEALNDANQPTDPCTDVACTKCGLPTPVHCCACGTRLPVEAYRSA